MSVAVYTLFKAVLMALGQLQKTFVQGEYSALLFAFFRYFYKKPTFYSSAGGYYGIAEEDKLDIGCYSLKKAVV
jgi:hypothetical protein